jgi:RND family efflux transporter MFP subunit
LFTLADLSALELELHLPERDAATVKLGTEVEIELSDRTLFVAKVERRAPIVDDLTGTVKFTAVAEDYPGAAMPGAFARARVLIDRADAAPSVERSAVFELDGKPHVFVIANGQARRVPIKLGLEGSKRFAVLEGLNAEHVVILAGNQGVTEGMRVKPAQATTSAADADQKESS